MSVAKIDILTYFSDIIMSDTYMIINIASCSKYCCLYHKIIVFEVLKLPTPQPHTRVFITPV